MMNRPKRSRGAAALGETLSERGSRRRLETEIGAGGGMVSRWISGRRVPTIVQGVWLARHYRIPIEWWAEAYRKA